MAVFRSRAVANAMSSIHLTLHFFIGSLLLKGWDICWPMVSLFVVAPAPLKSIENKLSPNMVPAPRPPGMSLALEVSFLYQSLSVLNER